MGTHGESATADRAVGAHQLHLNDGALSPAVACEECHAIPTSAGHSNGTVDMTWGALATTGGITGIVWSGSTCASTYCHGNFRNGNASNAPTWTAPRANPCGTCHGSPSNPAPGGTHPTVAAGDCGNCHDGYTGTTVNLALHLNGAFDVASLSCTSCHGTSGRVSVANADANQAAAPPVDTGGSSSTASPGVGAHLAHANNAGTSRPVLCGACHAGAVPTNPAHSNGTVTVAFGGLATTGGATPGPYTPGSGGSCSASYCHGNFPGGNGTAATPTWITAGALACTACHGSPPPLTATVHHPPNVGCTSCHPMGDPSVHVDGTVQKPSGCTACHGNLSLTGQTLANANTSAPGYDAGSVDSTGQ
ncbi:MAG TPA: CxxxxCH/CxxCH domain-containing protein, partial [Anaeromyxobacteraceae bacterium]|nr:CxxxxCH/CxxCH domain-containing protein [Anaeromyxobacteraceae bacterium]